MFYKITPQLNARADDQHRFLGDRGRRPAGQPHALQPVLSREARLLPARRRHLRVRPHRQQNGRPFFSRRIGLSDAAQPSISTSAASSRAASADATSARWPCSRTTYRRSPATSSTPTTRRSSGASRERARGIERRHDRDRRQPGSNVDNSLAGVDFLLPEQPAAGRQARRGRRLVAAERHDGRDRRSKRVRLPRVTPNNSGWRGGVALHELGEGFNPGLGFLNRPGVKTLDVGTRLYDRPRDGFLRPILSGSMPSASSSRTASCNRKSSIQAPRAREPRRRRALAAARSGAGAARRGFRDPDGIVIPLGHYSFDERGIRLATGDQRKLWGTFVILRATFSTASGRRSPASLLEAVAAFFEPRLRLERRRPAAATS